MKKIYYFILATIVLVGLNIWVWGFTLQLDYQLGWIAFLLVFLNIAIAWLLYNKSEALMYFFFVCSLIIEILLIVNYFWIQQLGKGL